MGKLYFELNLKANKMVCHGLLKISKKAEEIFEKLAEECADYKEALQASLASIQIVEKTGYEKVKEISETGDTDYLDKLIEEIIKQGFGR